MVKIVATEKVNYNIGGSVFWILIILINLVGLSFLGIWSYHNNSVRGAIISFLFFAMIITGIVLSRFEVFSLGTWSENALSFTLGFIIWLIIGGSGKSILSVSQNALFSTIASELPAWLEFATNSFVIPLAEEMFWMIGIPFSLITIMNLIGNKVKFFKNSFFQLTIITIFAGVTFAGFHVGKLFLSFLISAFLFRTIMIWAVIGDTKLDWLKGIRLLPAFAVGSHIGNNWADYGFVNGLNILLEYFSTFGWLVFLILIILFLSAINQLVVWVMNLAKD